MTGIIDYGAGNLMSVTNALRHLGADCLVSGDKAELGSCDRLILPGVGAFRPAMEALERAGLCDFIREQAEVKPLLGICLGMQMLFSESEEMGLTAGLGIIKGRVREIKTDLKLPCIGWNSLNILRKDCPLLRGVNEGDYVYFVHSYCGETADRADLAATAEYGEEVAAVVWRGMAYGAQFHPEKSSDVGLRMIENFVSLKA